MIELDGATLRVSASYGIKVPGAQPYSSEDAHYSFSIEQPLDDGVVLDDLISSAADLSQALETGVKLQAFSSLDIAFEEADGTLRPVFTVPDVPTTAPKAPAAKQQSYPRSSNKPTATRATIMADLGQGQLAYLDNRPLKATGEFKPGAADFRSVDKVDGRYHSVWIAQKDGTPNTQVVEALSAAGISA